MIFLLRMLKIVLPGLLTVIFIRVLQKYCPTNFTMVSGWSLFVLTIILMLFYLRKRIATIPIGRVYIWAQAHLIIGFWATLFLMFYHVQSKWPSGYFEILLYLVYILSAVSGIVLIALNRILPRYWRTQFGSVRAPIGVLWTEKNNIRHSFSALIEQLLNKPELAEFALPINRLEGALVEQYSIGLVQIFVLHAENYHIRTLAAQVVGLPDKKLYEQFNDLVKSLGHTNSHILWQLQLKFLLSLHIALAIFSMVLIFMHIAMVYGFTG